MGEIVEQPLMVNSDLISDQLLLPESVVYHSQLKQNGMFKVLYGSFIHMQRCLKDKLQNQKISLTRVDPGIYSQEHLDNLTLSESDKKE